LLLTILIIGLVVVILFVVFSRKKKDGESGDLKKPLKPEGPKPIVPDKIVKPSVPTKSEEVKPSVPSKPPAAQMVQSVQPVKPQPQPPVAKPMPAPVVQSAVSSVARQRANIQQTRESLRQRSVFGPRGSSAVVRSSNVVPRKPVRKRVAGTGKVRTIRKKPVGRRVVKRVARKTPTRNKKSK